MTHMIIINQRSPHFDFTESIFNYLPISFPNFVSFTVKSPGVTLSFVFWENTFKNSKNPSNYGSNNSLVLIENLIGVLR